MRPTDPSELGSYLRQRRALVAPPTTSTSMRDSRRRVPGLRRQELAQIASISVEYYTRLEQGRAPRPSRDVLAALARAFDLTTVERAHLFRLAGEPPPELAAPAAAVRPGLLRWMQHLDATLPVTVHDGRLDIVAAANAAATDLFGPAIGRGRHSRNMAYLAFTSPVFGRLLDEEGMGRLLRAATAELRVALGRYPADPYLSELVGNLMATSPAFREHWERGEVGTWWSALKRIRHPTAGWLDFDVEMLHDPDRDHRFMLYPPTSRESADGPVDLRTPPAGPR